MYVAFVPVFVTVTVFVDKAAATGVPAGPIGIVNLSNIPSLIRISPKVQLAAVTVAPSPKVLV